MEKQLEQNGIFTKAKAQCEGLTLSPQEAEEYRAYKRKQKVEQIMAAIARSETALLCQPRGSL